MISVTFWGTTAQLVSTLRESARAGNLAKVMKIFPETGRWQSIICHSLDVGAEWDKFPDRRSELLAQGKVQLVNTFFDVKIPDLEKTLLALYPEDQTSVAKAEESLRKLQSELREIRRRVHVSRWPENPFCQKDLSRAVDAFNASLPATCERWKITPEGFAPRRPKPSKRVMICGHRFRPRPAPREFEFTFPLTIAQIDKLLNFAGTWAKRLRNRPRTGRPPKPFNMLLFHVVKAFTQRCLTAKGEYIMKDGKFRVRKNWQLVCAAFLWLHMLYDIPEIKAFIKAHEKEEARAALKKFVSWAKREYSHFCDTGKGMGKWVPAFPDGSVWLNIPLVYLREDGSLQGQLI